MTRPINLKSVPIGEQPLSEQYRHTAKLWCDADAAASLLEETKGAELEERKIKLISDQGDMPDNKAERLIKGSAEWMDRLRASVRHAPKRTC
jgi:hypothetical protein